MNEELAKKYKNVNVLQVQNEEMKKGYSQVAKTMFGVQSSDVISARSTSQSNGANRPTIGETTISTKEVEIIQEEVRNTMQRVFPKLM